MWSRHTKKRLAVFECRLKHTDGVATLPRVLKKETAFFLSFCINAAREFFQKVIAGFTYTSKGLDCNRFKIVRGFPLAIIFAFSILCYVDDDWAFLFSLGDIGCRDRQWMCHVARVSMWCRQVGVRHHGEG